MAIGNTPNYNIPYPLGNDALSNVAERIQQMAVYLDQMFSSLDIQLNAILLQAGDPAGNHLKGTYPNPEINDNVITDTHINTNASISYSKLSLNNSIVTGDLAGQSVTTDKIANDAVTTIKIQNNSVTPNKIPDFSLISDKLADDINLRGNPTATTKPITDSSNSLATTSFVNTVASNFVLGILSANSVLEYMLDTDSVSNRVLAPDAVTSTEIADDSIMNADVNSAAGIQYSKLALSNSIVDADVSSTANISDTKLNTISTAGKVDNSATTATSSNTADTIVLRDSSGDFTASEGTFNGVKLNVSTPSPNGSAVIKWSVEDGGPIVGLTGNNVQLPFGQKNVIYVKNDSGTNILKAKPVMATGAVGDRIQVAKANANGSILAMYMLGVTGEAINNGQEGFVVTNGYIRNIDTSAWPLGTILYFDPTQIGELTDVSPAKPGLYLPIAIVTRQHSMTGIIYVRMTTGMYLNEIHDMDISGLAGGDSLEYDSALSRWRNVPFGNVPIGTITAFAGLSPPPGWLLCNGDVVPNGSGTVQGNTFDYTFLYNTVGSSYGSPGTLPTFVSTTGIYIIKAV
jgi:hypothetical protein